MKALELEIILKNYYDEPSKTKLNSLIQNLNELTNTSLSTLNSYCIQNKTIRQLLALADFQPFWLQKMAGIKIKGLPNFKFKETENLNAFELTLGYFNYFQALKTLKIPDQQTKYIGQALSFHSFQALNHYAEELIKQFKADDVNSFIQTLEGFGKEAVSHGTAGFLLIAQLYYLVALTLKHSNQESARTAFILVIKNIELAKLTETDSKDELHNAYFGQDFSQSNPFNLPNYKAIKEAVSKQAGSLLDGTDLSLAIKAANLSKPVREPKSPEKIKAPLSELHLTILADSAERLFLINKEEFENLDSWGETPLFFATRHGKINSLRYILSQGANSCLTDYQAYKYLQLVITIDHVGIKRLIKNHFFEQNQLDLTINSSKENLSLSQALDANSSELMRQALVNGANPDLILADEKTAIEKCYLSSNKAGIELLLDFGASVLSSNSKGETILFTLLEKNPATSKLAIEGAKTYFRRFVVLGANLNAQNKAGETLLIKAVKRRDLNTLTFLLSQIGIDLDLKDSKGQTAFSYAENQENTLFSDLLRQHSQSNLLQNRHKNPAISGLTTSFFSQSSAAPESGIVTIRPGLS
ncbi:MAG: DUF5630 domain-containing protein [Tatlockia sp.]|nr:DUF5630 domain-containing protein [Tatlockia sp.]